MVGMNTTPSSLQRTVGIGGSATLLGLLVLGYPIYLSLRPQGSFAGFLQDDTTIVLFAVLVVFAMSAAIRHRTARIAQVLVLILFGYLTLASAVLGALTGLAIASVGVMLAAHYGYLRNQTRIKAVAIVFGTLLSLAIQAASRSSADGLSWTALQFSYNAVGVLGLAASYLVVLRDAAASASRRQAALQQAVDDRTQALSREVESRKRAEELANRSAETAEQLAVERLELLREVHHRAKNSLQMTLTLLEMSDYDSPEATVATINRVRAIGLVYDLVDSAVDLSSISLEEYTERLASHIQMSAEYGPVMIDMSLGGDHRTRIEPTINFGLMVHEVVSLICRHAYELQPGTIRLSQVREEEYLRLDISHRGKELPPSVEPNDALGSDLGLLPALLERLHCQATLSRGDTTTWSFRLPVSVMTG